MFKVTIKTGNSAFADPYTGEEDNYYECGEVARILREVADKVEAGQRSGKTIDYNGNSVGEFTF